MSARILLVSSIILGLFMMSCAPAAPPPTPKATSAPSKAEAPVAQVPTTATPPSASPKPAEGPKYGGVLTLIRWGDLPTFDVHQETTFNVQGTLLTAYSGLIQCDPLDAEKIIPDLAANWDVSPDGKTITFKLRSGVTFHDGKELTPADVKLSLDRLRDPPKGAVSPRQPTLAAIADVETSGNQVKVNLKYPSVSLLPMLAVGQIVVFPKHILDAKGSMKRDIVGTGPYKLKEYREGSTLDMVKNPSYFIPQRPYLDGIKFFIVRDAGTRLAAFRTSRVQLYGGGGPGPTASEAEIIAKELPGASVIKFPALTYRALLFNAKEPPWNDARMRRAAGLAIDRRDAVRSLTQGIGDIGSYFVPGTQWATPQEELLKLPGYREAKDADIAEAKRLLAEAGFPNGLKTKMLVSASLTADLGVFLADQLTKVNITAELEVVDHGVFGTRLNRKAFILMAQPPGMRSPDPVEIGRYLVSGCLACGALEDKKVDDLFDRIDRALDPNERRKLTLETDKYLMEIVPSAVAYYGREIAAVAPEVKNYNPGLGWYNNHKYQDIWLSR